MAFTRRDVRRKTEIGSKEETFSDCAVNYAVWTETNECGLRATMEIVVDVEDVRSPVRFIMKGKSGLKLPEYGFSWLSQELRFPIYASNARIIHVLKHAQQTLYP